MPLPHWNRPPLFGTQRRAQVPRDKPLGPGRRHSKAPMQIPPRTPSLERRDLLLKNRGRKRLKHSTCARQMKPRMPTPRLGERWRQRARVEPRPVVPTAKQLRRRGDGTLGAIAEGHEPRAVTGGPDDERGNTLRCSRHAPPIPRGGIAPHGWVVCAARQHPKCEPDIDRLARLVDRLDSPTSPRHLPGAHLAARRHPPFAGTPITAPRRGWSARCAKRGRGHAGSLTETTDIRCSPPPASGVSADQR